jgi:hypothetical protein
MAVPAEAVTMAQFAATQPDAPVQIQTCSSTFQMQNNRWGTHESTLNLLVDFKNSSSKQAVAVLVRFQMTNAFGVVLDNVFEQATGTFSPDAIIRGNHWSEIDTWPGLSIMQCSVNRVQFSDGSAWSEPRIQPSPSPSPS